MIVVLAVSGLCCVLWWLHRLGQRPFVPYDEVVDRDGEPYRRPRFHPRVRPGMSVAERCAIEDYHYRRRHCLFW